MPQLAQSILSMNALLAAEDINQDMLAQLIQDSIDRYRDYLALSGSVIPILERLKIETKISTGLSMLSLLRCSDIMGRVSGDRRS